jgi:hypothetical protein
MGEVRIVKLGPVSNGNEAVSFEEAFGYGVGGYSYANGEGRAKRKARKLDRIGNRSEVKSARQDARGARTQGRQENRQDRVAGRQQVQAQRVAGRTDLQLARKDKRLSKREMGTESRIGRRMQRTDLRQYRRDLRNPSDVPNTQSGYETGVGSNVPSDAGATTTTGSGYAPTTQSGGYAPSTDSGSYDTQSGGYAPSTDSGSYDTQSGGYTPSTDSGYDDVYDQSLVDETAQDAYEMGYQDANEDAGIDVEIGGDENYGDFDGVMGAEDRYNELQDKNDFPVQPQVQALADKCVWNEMLITSLEGKRKNSKGNPQEISKTILQRKKRLKDLNNELEDFANYCGNYSSAEGSPEMIDARKQVVRHALRKARMKAMGQAPISKTEVSGGLKPQFGSNRIVVPASEPMANATGTGLNGLDLQNDFDAPDAREFYLGADGSFTKGIDLGSIAVGVLLTVGFIALNKKYKWIKM